METISVIIPTWNRAETLVSAVESALGQTYPVLEVLVCDDGSDDNSRERIAEMNDLRVKWLDCGKNGGPAVPRNKGIEKSKGNWIAFLDSDDEWLPQKLEKQMLALEKYSYKAACTNAYRINKGKIEGAYLSYQGNVMSFADLLRVNSIICSSVLVNKQLLTEPYLFPISKEFIAIEDYALWLRLSVLNNFVFINEPLVNYNDNNEISVRTHHTDPWLISEIVFADLKQWSESNTIQLNKEQQKRLNVALRNVKNKGQTSIWEYLKQYLRSRFIGAFKI